jgi:hypothetical protein
MSFQVLSSKADSLLSLDQACQEAHNNGISDEKSFMELTPNLHPSL